MSTSTKSARRLLKSQRLRDQLGRLALGTSIGVVAVVALAYLKPDPRVYATAEVITEFVRLDVVDSRKSAFYIGGVHINTLGEPLANASTACVSGLITPTLGTVIEFGRTARGSLEITLTPPSATREAASDPVGVLESENAAPVTFRGGTFISTDSDCSPANQRLPLWGPLQIGQEFRPASASEAPTPSFLLGGKLEVAAHTAWRGTPYQVTTITLPVGARMQANDPEGTIATKRAIWWGTITVDKEHSALDLALATEAPAVALFRPNQTRADVISLSVLTEMTKDPSYLLLALFLGVGLYVLEKFLRLADFWQDTVRDEREQKAED